MATERFVSRNFSINSRMVIQHANKIIADYQAAGFKLTLRQLYYQFVARGLIPNKQSEYKKLGSIVNDGRLAGLIDWSAIEDRTRNVEFIPSWSSPARIVRGAADGYQEDLWRNQDYHVEVWIEKEALFGVIEPACLELRVPHFACRGYVSQSEAYDAGKRFRRMTAKDIVVVHLGDHDPSGIDMTRDIEERVSMFAGRPVTIRRIALNMDQIEEHNPPPNPAKATDSRFEGYLALHGDESWELDALDPTLIDTLIRDEIEQYIDRERWEEAEAQESENKERLDEAAKNWPNVARYLKYRGEAVMRDELPEGDDVVTADTILADIESRREENE